MSSLSFDAPEQGDLFANDADFRAFRPRLTRPRGRPMTPIAGKRFRRLLAIGPTRKGRDKHIFWICRCSCSRRVVVSGDNLRRGRARSCGCLSRELSRQRMRAMESHKARLKRADALPSGDDLAMATG